MESAFHPELIFGPARADSLPVFGRPDPGPLQIKPGDVNHYAVSADGQKFLVLEPERTRGEPLTILLDWTTRLEHR